MARQGHRSQGRHKPRTTAPVDRSDWINQAERLRAFHIDAPAWDALEYWQEHLTDQLYVYLITEDGGDREHVKIGQALDPFRRLLSLQTGNPRRLKLTALLVATATLEASLHVRFKDFGTRGEWFAGGMGAAICTMAEGVMVEQIDQHRAGEPLHRITEHADTAMHFPRYNEAAA